MMKNLEGEEYECSQDDDDCDVMWFKNRETPQGSMQSGSRVNQSSPMKQESRYAPLLEWSDNETQPKKQNAL